MTFEIAIATPLLVRHARGNPTIPQRAKPAFCRDPTAPGYFEHILGLLHSASLAPSGQNSTRTGPCRSFGGVALSPSAACDQSTNAK
jgi:hypothetical protein